MSNTFGRILFVATLALAATPAYAVVQAPDPELAGGIAALALLGLGAGLMRRRTK